MAILFWCPLSPPSVVKVAATLAKLDYLLFLKKWIWQKWILPNSAFYTAKDISSMFSMKPFSDKSMGSLMLSILFETFFVPRNTRLNGMRGSWYTLNICFNWRPLQICLALVIGMLVLSYLLGSKFLKREDSILYLSMCLICLYKGLLWAVN